MKHLLVTEIKTDLPKEEVMGRAEERSDHFLTVPGLMKKFWTYDEDSDVFQGIFEFESREQIENYLSSDFADGVAEAYETTKPVETKILKVLKEQED